MAAEAQAEYLRKVAAKETETPNRVVEAIKEFKRRNSDLTSRRTDRATNVGPKPTDDERSVPRAELSLADQTTEETESGTEKPVLP
jgi:hypothetical protein